MLQKSKSSFLSFLKRPRSDNNILERWATFKLITRGSKEVTEGQDPMRSTGESRAWQLCRQHPYSCMILGKSLYIRASAQHWLAETHVGVRRVRWAGAALHRPAGNTELPHRQPQRGGARDSPGRANFPRRVAPQRKPAPRDPACLRSRRSVPRLTSPRPAPRHRRARRCAHCANSACAPRPACAAPNHVRGPVSPSH